MYLLQAVRHAIVLTMMLASLRAAAAGLEIERVGESVVDPRVLVLGDPKYGAAKFSQVINGVTGQQEAIVSHNGFQYITYYDGDRRVCVARRELPQGQWQVVRLKDYLFKSNDGHNFISMGICPGDGTIHLAFDHHANALHYRVSKKDAATHPKQTEWDASLFGPVRSELDGKAISGLTYPRFLPTPEGKLQLFYRLGTSGGGNMWMDDYDPTTGKWANHRQIDSGAGTYTDRFISDKSRCSYPNAYTYDANGRLHVTWVWRETSGASSNHDLMYAYSDDQGITWLSDSGEKFSRPAAFDSPGVTVVKIPTNNGLSNQTCQAVDSEGRIHVILRHAIKVDSGKDHPANAKKSEPPATAHFHYWRKGPGQWQMNPIPGGEGARPKLFIDSHNNAWMVTQRSGQLLIMSASAEKQWQDWQVSHTEKSRLFNEILADPVRWKSEGILSVFAVDRPAEGFEPTKLRIIDFNLEKKRIHH